MKEFRISFATIDDTRVIALRGEWDIASKAKLRDAFSSLGSERDVLVDLRQATFFDSSALGELVGAFKRVTRAGHRFEALVGDSMRRLFEITSLDGLLAIPSERAAYYTERLAAATP